MKCKENEIDPIVSVDYQSIFKCLNTQFLGAIDQAPHVFSGYPTD